MVAYEMIAPLEKVSVRSGMLSESLSNGPDKESRRSFNHDIEVFSPKVSSPPLQYFSQMILYG